MTGKEKIVKASIELFAYEGFERTSIQRLAETSGVAQGLLYRHFRSKNDLLSYLMQMAYTQIAATLLPYQDVNLKPSEAYLQHIDKCVALLPDNTLLWKTIHSIRSQTGLMTELGIKIDFEQEVIEPIAACMTRGGVTDGYSVAWTIVSLVDGMTAMYLLHPDLYPLHTIANHLKSKAHAIIPHCP